MNITCPKSGHTGEFVRCVCINKNCSQRFLCSLCFHDISSEHNHGTKDIIDDSKFISKGEAAYQKFIQTPQKLVVADEEEAQKLMNMIKFYKDKIFEEINRMFQSIHGEIAFYSIKHWFPQALDGLKGSDDLEYKSDLLDQITRQINEDFEIVRSCNLIHKMAKTDEAKSLSQLLERKLKIIDRAIMKSIQEHTQDSDQTFKQFPTKSEELRIPHKKLEGLIETECYDLKSNLESKDIAPNKKHSKLIKPKTKNQKDLPSSKQADSNGRNFETKSQAKKNHEDIFGDKIKKKVCPDNRVTSESETRPPSLSKENSKCKSSSSMADKLITFDKTNQKPPEENKPKDLVYNPYVSMSAVNLHEKSKDNLRSFQEALSFDDSYFPITIQKKKVDSASDLKRKPA